MSSYGIEKAVTIRQPSTANFMIDSKDAQVGASTNPGSLLFNSPQAFVNGFFTRLGTTEAVLDWRLPNVIGPDANGFQFAIDISGGASGVVCRVPTGFYTVSQLIDAVVAQMNANGAGTVTVTQNGVLGKTAITSNTAFRFSSTQPLTNLNGWTISRIVPVGGALALSKAIVAAPFVNTFTYIDFVSNQLTANQDLKDTNTTATPYDVLLRWYLETTDEQVYLDKYGYPVKKGTIPFFERRLFSPPKQIKWDSNIPVAQFNIDLNYQIEGITGPPEAIAPFLTTISSILTAAGITVSTSLSYRLTIQLSEN
jgi:hypothetical protein